jgi:hypothetical protein
MDAVQTERPAIDGPTLGAAVTTLLFAVVSGLALSYIPEVGKFGGAIDALKNLMYVLTVPFFDIVRRILSRRKQEREHTAAPEQPNILTVAFVSALTLFVLIEALSWLTGFGVGGICNAMSNPPQDPSAIGGCLALGISIMSYVIIGPIMIALGIACGWIWQRLLPRGLLIALLLFAIAIAILFALDFFILLQNAPEVANRLKEQMNEVGPIRQIGLQIVILAPSLLIGYGARRLWSSITGIFA